MLVLINDKLINYYSVSYSSRFSSFFFYSSLNFFYLSALCRTKENDKILLKKGKQKKKKKMKLFVSNKGALKMCIMCCCCYRYFPFPFSTIKVVVYPYSPYYSCTKNGGMVFVAIYSIFYTLTYRNVLLWKSVKRYTRFSFDFIIELKYLCMNEICMIFYQKI